MSKSVTVIRAVTILGSGKWGVAFGRAIARSRTRCGDKRDIIFWDRRKGQAEQAAAAAGCRFVDSADFVAAVNGADLIVVAVSSGAFAEMLQRIVETETTAPVAWLTKGFEPQTRHPLPAAAAAVLGKDGRYAAVSGPSFAEDVAADKPTALAVAANHRQDAVNIRDSLHGECLRFYLEDDIMTLSVAAAVKNIIAVAAGAGDAMQLGDNARAAVITRGLAEIAALCQALGGRAENLLGLSGVGDLVLTCSSDKSRNRRLGLLLGNSPDAIYTAEELERRMPDTCESVTAAASVLHWINHYSLEAPILRATTAVLLGQTSPAQALAALLARPSHGN